MIALLVLAALIATSALYLHHRHWRRGAAAHFVLAAVPAALLFVILPIPVLMLSTVRGFQRLALEGKDSSAAAAALSLEINRALWLGTLGTLTTIVVAALLQWRADRAGAGTDPESPRTWRDWILVACAMVLLPTVLLGYVADEVPRTVIRAMEAVTGGTPARVPPAELSALSAKIAALLITGVIGGMVLAIAGVAAAAGAVFAARGIPQPRRPSHLPWVLAAIVVLLAGWNAVRLPLERRWMERVATAASQRPFNRPQ